MKKKFTLLFTFFAILFFQPAFAQEVFDGGCTPSCTPTDWNEDGNWVDGSSPGCGNLFTSITIESDCVIDNCSAGFGVNARGGLTINSGAKLTVASGIGGNGLEARGLLNIQGTIEILSVGVLWQGNDPGSTISGTIDVQNGYYQSADPDVTHTSTSLIKANGGTVYLVGEYEGTIMGVGPLLMSQANPVGGTIEPGNSVGTLNVSGSNKSFDGTINIEADNRTTYDVINSTNSGALTITGTTFNFTLAGTANDYANGDKFQVFTNFGSYTGVPTTINSNLGIVMQYNGNGEFEIQSGGLLPVELIDFTARENDNAITLHWRTASELNNEGFEIQRSANGTAWEEIAFINGHGTTIEEQSYAHTDKRPLPGMNYYRLKQMDFDGKFDYSQLVSVNLKKQDSELSLFPNPAQQSVTLQLESNYTGDAVLQLYNHLGQLVQTETLLLEEGFFKTSIDLSDLPAGVYLVNMEAGQNAWRETLVVQ